MNLDKGKLRGKKIGILAGDGFEYAELAVPKAALKAAGADVDVISLHEGRIRGMNLAEPTRTVHVDRLVEDASVEDYDGLLIVGGFVGPDFVRQNEQARSFVCAFDRAFKPIATLCHGPWVLISAGCANGRRLASWPGVRDDIVNAGGICGTSRSCATATGYRAAARPICLCSSRPSSSSLRTAQRRPRLERWRTRRP